MTAPAPPRRAVLRESQLHSSLRAASARCRSPGPCPEALLLIRLDLGVQLPQSVREAAEEQVTLRTISSVRSTALHHLCASAAKAAPGEDEGAKAKAQWGGAGREHRPVTPRPAYQRARIARRAPVAPPSDPPRTRPAAPITITQLKERMKAALLAGFYWQRQRQHNVI